MGKWPGPMKDPFGKERSEPRGVVEKRGRSYSVWVQHGWGRYAPDGLWWERWSRKSAERKARKELARYLKKHCQPVERWEVD